MKVRYLYGMFTVFIVACFDVPTGFTDYLDERTVAEEVFFVNCLPLSYSISLAATGACEALNADSTLIQVSLPRWVSSCPACILVNESGDLFVGDVVQTGVRITAHGPNGSFALSPSLEVVP